MAPTHTIVGELSCGDVVNGDTRGLLNGVSPNIELLPSGDKIAIAGQDNAQRGDCYVMYVGGVFPPQGAQMTPLSGPSRVINPGSIYYTMPTSCEAGSDCVGALVCPKPPLPGTAEPQLPYGVNSAAFQAGSVLLVQGTEPIYFPAFSVHFNILPGTTGSRAYIGASIAQLRAQLEALLQSMATATSARVVACELLPGGGEMTYVLLSLFANSFTHSFR